MMAAGKPNTLDLRYRSADELLKQYWGYLSEGGLVLQKHPSLKPNQIVDLTIRVSGEIRCTLRASVIRAGRDRQIVKFLPNEPHEQLLFDSLAVDEHDLVGHQSAHIVF